MIVITKEVPKELKKYKLGLAGESDTIKRHYKDIWILKFIKFNFMHINSTLVHEIFIELHIH